MRFDTKIAIAVRDGLAPWQELNVAAFLASGIAAAYPEIIGKPYEDGDGNAYLSLYQQPVLLYQGQARQLATVLDRARARQLPAAIYTMDMFATGNDEDNRAVVRAAGAADLDLAGLAVFGPRNAVDKILRGTTLHA